MYIQVVKLWPSEHRANKLLPLIEWTDEGLAFYEAHKADDPPAELTPGLRWKVIEPEAQVGRRDYITYPSIPGTALDIFRHEWVMMLQARPFVPQPSGAPMPDKRHSVKERARILSVYLRPWFLSRCDVSTHVPHLTQLNTMRNWNDITRDSVRKRSKLTPISPQTCSYREACYVCSMTFCSCPFFPRRSRFHRDLKVIEDLERSYMHSSALVFEVGPYTDSITIVLHRDANTYIQTQPN